jgi:hypothetical protein
MSAAQALSSGPIAPASGARPSSSGGSAGESGAPSFRDALETASRSGEPAQESRVASDRTRENGRRRNDAGQDRGGDRPGGETDVPRTEPATAAELSAMLVALGAGPGSHSDAVDFPRSGGSPGVSSGTGDKGGEHAGLSADGGETLDAAQLLALLRSGKAASRDLPADAMTLKVTVTGQETHLALDRTSAETFAALSGAEGAADAITQAAGLSQSADEAARLVRLRDGAGAVVEAKSEGGLAPRVAATAEASGQGGSTAFADQGIAGQDGRPADGRGASGGGAQQQGSAVFMALAGATPQPAGAVGGADGADVAPEPISEQIARHVRAEVKTAGLGEASDGVVKVLNLELKPANMGAVTIRIALKDNAIVVHLEAQRSETLQVIERERQALTNALSAAGYSVDGITAAPQSEAGRSLGGAFAGLGNPGSAAPQGQSSGPGQGLAGSSGGQGGSAETGGGHPSYRPPPDDKDTGGGGLRRGGDGLYV